MEYKTFKSEAIVIREKDFAEQDKFFTVFAREYGKMGVLAKSVRKIDAKLRAGLQLLNYVSLEFVRGKNFNIATDAIVKDEFLKSKSSPSRFRDSLYICNILDNLIKGEEADEKTWKLLLESLRDLEAHSNRFIFIHYFEWNLVSALGFKPELYFCLGCQERIKKGRFFFSIKDGGIFCGDCLKKKNLSRKKMLSLDKIPGTQEISKDAIKTLRLITEQNKEVLERLKIHPPLLKELKDLSKSFLSYIAEQ
ncbi:MAG: DNA repair protein RecO [Patescibacteria group bacterium]